MTIYTFVPGSTNLANWNDPKIWGGVIPNALDADVLLTPATFGSGQTYYDLDINPGAAYAIRSLTDTGAGLAIGGTLSISGAAIIQTSAYLYGPRFSAGSLQVGLAATVYGAGAMAVGSGVNLGTLSLVGATATFGTFQNSGVVVADGGPTATLVVTGGTGPVTGGVLSGGTYEAAQSTTLQIRAAGVITTDAAIIELGAPLTSNLTTSQILSFDATTGTYRPLESTLTAIAVGGALLLTADIYAGTVGLTVAGALTLAQGARFSGPGLVVAAGGRVSGLGTITAPVVNNGVLAVAASSADLLVAPGAVAQTLVVHGAISGAGTVQVGVGGAYGSASATPLTLELDGAVNEGVVFQGSVGILRLDQVASFKGRISGFSGQDSILVANARYAAVTGYSYAGTASGGVLTVNQGASSFALAFNGSYTTGNFALAAGVQPGTLAISAVDGSGSAGGGSSTGGGSGSGGSTNDGTTVTIGGAETRFGTGPLVGYFDGLTGNSASGGLEPVAAGGPGYLQWQFINAGTSDLAISTQAPNVFLHSGSGTDALQVSSGTNVLDGGLGSNFLTGGSGTDTFFTDARAPGAVWNTLRNFHVGDAATLYGFTAGVSSYTWDAALAGAPGSQGATLRANIVGGAGRTGNGIDASITFTGLSVAQAQALQVVTGTNPAGNYLYLYNPGV